ncbi:polyprenol reductase isoform X1 [Schistocerca nitens]|uniref:polyprenol reductase isoform X1 n=1 Tax=Schistocerca nitens TaxID=7011 RepID=UPI0021197CC7|nr:polyprenol reductase isoform X1 [Schistocerca nitens]
MLDLNLLKIGFALLTLVMIVLGSLMNTVEKRLPSFVKQTFRYGRFAYQGKDTFLKPIEVPKRWFRHFYVFGAFFTSLIFVVVLRVYVFHGKPHPLLLALLDLLGSTSRRANVSPTSILLALFLLTLQSWHRFYETWFISIYSNSYINIYHYIIGYGHYFGSVMAVLCESPGFINNQEQRVQLNFGDISFLEVIGVTMFLWACYNQYRSAIILANLRKNKNGQVVTTKHSIPYGGWFELVSSPHFLAEILMYMAISIILRAANTWHVVFLWVLSNQVESGLLSHWWYKATFPNYPKERKAVIPYVL